MTLDVATAAMPSMTRDEMVEVPLVGVMVYVCDAPDATVVVPKGAMVPGPLTEATMVKVGVVDVAKTASIVWFATTLLKVKGDVVACATPSTTSEMTVDDALGVNVYAWLPPEETVVVPRGAITPGPDCVETISKVGTAAKTALIVWSVVTFVKVYELVVATDIPSILSTESVDVAFGVIVNA